MYCEFVTCTLDFYLTCKRFNIVRVLSHVSILPGRVYSDSQVLIPKERIKGNSRTFGFFTDSPNSKDQGLFLSLFY